jgi:uncharacterized protein (TIGR02996 family)
VTTEDDFQAALDARPEDWQTRLVFADWLQERGDLRAEGYRALGRNRFHPYVHNPKGTKKDQYRGAAWWSPTVSAAGALPEDWFLAISGFGTNRTYRPLLMTPADSASRRQMDDAAALAFGTLPPPRRTELLAVTAAEESAPRKRRRRKSSGEGTR